MAYVIRKGSKFYLAESKWTSSGSRQTCTYIGSGPLLCRTLAELEAHLIELRDMEETKHKIILEPLRQIFKAENGNMARCLKRPDYQAMRQAILRRYKRIPARLKWIVARIRRITIAKNKLRAIESLKWGTMRR